MPIKYTNRCEYIYKRDKRVCGKACAENYCYRHRPDVILYNLDTTKERYYNKVCLSVDELREVLLKLQGSQNRVSA